jgi:hypothetical protein
MVLETGGAPLQSVFAGFTSVFQGASGVVTPVVTFDPPVAQVAVYFAPTASFGSDGYAIQQVMPVLASGFTANMACALPFPGYANPASGWSATVSQMWWADQQNEQTNPAWRAVVLWGNPNSGQALWDYAPMIHLAADTPAIAGLAMGGVAGAPLLGVQAVLATVTPLASPPSAVTPPTSLGNCMPLCLPLPDASYTPLDPGPAAPAGTINRCSPWCTSSCCAHTCWAPLSSSDCAGYCSSHACPKPPTVFAPCTPSEPPSNSAEIALAVVLGVLGVFLFAVVGLLVQDHRQPSAAVDGARTAP